MSDLPHDPADSDLLTRLDALLDGGDPTPGGEPDPLATTVRLLQAAAPVPDPAFAARLGDRLAAERGAPPRRHRVLRWAGVLATAMLTLVLILTLSPNARLAVAAALDTAQRTWLRITSGPDGLVGLEPPPPFTARQFRPTPPDFTLVGNRYAPATDGVVGWSATTWQGATVLEPDPAIQEALERDRGTQPHLVLAYRSSHGDYLVLYQRAAEPGEALPAGEARQVGAAAATLRTEGQRRVLTWTQGDTWTELESTLDEAQTLALALTLAPLDATTVSEVSSPPAAWGDALRQMGEPRWCDPAQQPPEPMLGRVEGQRLQGSIWLTFEQLGGREQVNPALGFNVPDRNAVIDAAIATVEDTAQPLVQLPYPSVGRGSYDETAGCLVPAQVPGYLVIEVWEREVRLGYGGVGDQRRAEALAALAELRSP